MIEELGCVKPRWLSSERIETKWRAGFGTPQSCGFDTYTWVLVQVYDRGERSFLLENKFPPLK